MPSTTKRRCITDEEQEPGFVYWSILPEELKVAILCRLKCKQLIRLKCVSKSWHLLVSSRCAHIITSPRFCGIIMTQYKLNWHGACIHACDSFYESLMSSAPFLNLNVADLLKKLVPFEPQPEELQDCCNGVLLIAHLAKCPRQYYVCNPTTHQRIEVPVNAEHCVRAYNASLVFDPRDKNSPNSFMVVVPRKYLRQSLKLDVFSSRLGNWSSCIVPLDSVVNGCKLIERCVYLKGTLFMLSADKYLVSIFLTGTQGKSSNSVGRTLSAASRAIELPGKNEFKCCGSFGTSKGKLVYSNSNSSSIMIWGLDNGDQWVLQHRITVKELVAQPVVQFIRSYSSLGGLLKVCAFDPYSDEIFVAADGRIHHVLKYNPRTKELKDHYRFYTSHHLERVFPVSLCAITLDTV